MGRASTNHRLPADAERPRDKPTLGVCGQSSPAEADISSPSPSPRPQSRSQWQSKGALDPNQYWKCKRDVAHEPSEKVSELFLACDPAKWVLVMASC
ncbi:hypothetical protein NDU88_008628 [Pleurodeles waltl]|uniref:Uncharacterized protein n=1 Tax=Pleurodeles waltl TaxID=8319 RepID=A0AAV7QSC7_PLEWA|nr:hypothetical protein NDU88_008628 [Pleurodeles waltl]